jgi:glycosyltransferase involved in cell wall biosynthesis
VEAARRYTELVQVRQNLTTATAEAETATAEAAHRYTELVQVRQNLATATAEAETATAEAARRYTELVRVRQNLATATAEVETATAEAARRYTELVQVRQNLTAEKFARETAQRAHDRVSAELTSARGEIARLQWELGVILGSTLWRAMEPLRRMGRAIPPSRRQQIRRLVRGVIPSLRRSNVSEGHAADQQHRAKLPIPPLTHAPVPQSSVLDPPVSHLPLSHVDPEFDSLPALESIAHAAALSTRRIVFVSGEAHTPGHVYRVMRQVEAAAHLGIAVSWMMIEQVWDRGDEISSADIVIIWRAGNSAMVAEVFSRARAARAKVLFDIDDYMFRPELATPSVIDGIRTLGHDVTLVAATFQGMQEVAVHADACICTTEELAHQMREFNPITFILPNGFDAAVLRTSRRAVRRRARDPDGLVRLGYAAGTRTHQADFQIAANAIGRVLRERPQCRLVLFRDPAYQTPILDAAEFPGMAGLDEQIEWRDMVSLRDLPNELARFDINLAPLEVGNPFCEAKSELKYFEAALVEVCTIASPTAPMRRAIHDAETGLLAESTDVWYAAMLALVDDPTLRRRLAHDAYLDVLWRFGPQYRMAALSSILQQMEGAERGATAFELDLRRRANAARQRFDIPEAERIFVSDRDELAEVTVVIPVYNYARYVIEALDSVLHQTLGPLDLVVVDDASTDESLTVARDWASRHASRFNRLLVLRNCRNSGLARARNAGFDAAETPFILPLDADNRLRPECTAKCLRALRGSQAAFAYPYLQCFGGDDEVRGTPAFSAIRFATGNYIDAMALVAKWAWAAVGGYEHIIPSGWEDYDFWCRCVEHGLWGQQVPEVLADYRVHDMSMLHTHTDTRENKLRVIDELKARHAWLSIPYYD